MTAPLSQRHARQTITTTAIHHYAGHHCYSLDMAVVAATTSPASRARRCPAVVAVPRQQSEERVPHDDAFRGLHRLAVPGATSVMPQVVFIAPSFTRLERCPPSDSGIESILNKSLTSVRNVARRLIAQQGECKPAPFQQGNPSAAIIGQITRSIMKVGRGP